MRGQWLGIYHGSSVGEKESNGQLMINIDEVGEHFEGVAYLNPSDRSLYLPTVAYFSTQNKHITQATKAFIQPVDPRTGFPTSWEEIKKWAKEQGRELNNEETYSTEADVNLSVQEGKLYVDGVDNIGAKLSAVLEKPTEIGESKINGHKMSWSEFKSRLPSLTKPGLLFRGQQQPWSLCTSFHRGGRYRISEFINKDVRQLHRKLSAITPHYFDLTVPDQNGAFFNLLQHHGYPTPLLDWSFSPYVAAFFAFRGRPIGYHGDDFVRIYVFDNEEWQKRYRQIQYLDPPYPHLSVMEFIAINNPRLVPQQAVTTVTNLHDIEAYIMDKERETNLSLLTAIDIPAKEREAAMRELRLMGITAGSMFPGIEGVCEEVRENNFDR